VIASDRWASAPSGATPQVRSETNLEYRRKRARIVDGASEQTIAKALVGDYRSEHLLRFVNLSRVDTSAPPLEKPKDLHKPRRNELRFDPRTELYRIFGVDLTQIPGINALTAHTLLAEVGPDLSRFATPSAFASARTLSGQPDQWRQNTFGSDPRCKKPRGEVVEDGSSFVA
jgi:transposase